jgi:hypothetical protein
MHLPLSLWVKSSKVVILKKGTSAEDKFTVNMSSGLNTRLFLNMKEDAFQYYPLTWEAIKNSRPMGTPAC